MMSASDKVDIVFGIFATGIYRPWWWANYPAGKQAAVRAEWLAVVGRFSAREIREGLRRWSELRGVDNPPSAREFADFIRPVHSSGSRRFFGDVRQLLN